MGRGNGKGSGPLSGGSAMRCGLDWVLGGCGRVGET